MKSVQQILLVFLSITISAVLYAQKVDFDNFKPLSSSGDMPSDFSERTSDKVRADIANQIRKEEKRSDRNKKSDFLLKSNYMVDNLLMSGNVLYGDPTSTYVNKVADKILQNEPELRKKLRFYCIKSNVTNAFTTNQGMIFITLGLLAQLENEAQLAFILGHEITHYQKKHIINTLIETDKILNSKDRTTRISQDNNIIKLSNYSKSLELESDKLGFNFMQDAGYDIEEVLSTFDVLQYSHLPFDEIDLDFSELETEGFKIPEEYLLDTLNPINFEVDEDDSKGTHPNLNKRRDEITDIISLEESSTKGVKYLVSKDEFKSVRKMARFESIRINLKKLNFVKAYYNATILLKENPNSIYLRKSISKALYGIGIFKMNDNFKYTDDYSDSFEGSISAAYHFYLEIKTDIFVPMAIKYIYETNRDNPNQHLESILQDLIYSYIKLHGSEEFDFDRYFPDTKSQVKVIVKDKEDETDLDSTKLKHIDDSDNGKASKYDKLRKIKSIQDGEIADDNVNDIAKKVSQKYYFVDYKDRNDIKIAFQKALDVLNGELLEKEEKKEAYDKLTDRQQYSYDRIKLREEDKDYDNRNKVGAEKLVFVDPVYYEVDERKGVKLEDSEDSKYDFYEQIKTVSAAANIESEILSPKLSAKSEFNKMNHLSICNDWIEELNDLQEISEDLKSYIPSQSEYMKLVSEAYDTENICFTGIVDVKVKKEINSSTAMLCLIIPYTWPFAAYYLLSDSHQFYYFTYVYNANSGKMIVDKMYFNKKKPMDGNIQSYMYDLFTTINTKNED